MLDSWELWVWLCVSTLTGCLRKLEPRLTEAEQFDIIKTSLDHTLAVPPLVATSEKKGRDPAFQQVRQARVLSAIHLTHTSAIALSTQAAGGF